MKNLICYIFGHEPPVYSNKGWFSPGQEYARVDPKAITTDGIGRKHAIVYSDCPRCGQRFKLCRIHLPTE